MLKQKAKLIKFNKKVIILHFNASVSNEFEFLTIMIKIFSNDFEFYITEIIRIFVVETSVIVDDMSTKKRIIKFKNIEFYHDKIVKIFLNFVRNVYTTFKVILENYQMYR